MPGCCFLCTQSPISLDLWSMSLTSSTKFSAVISLSTISTLLFLSFSDSNYTYIRYFPCVLCLLMSFSIFNSFFSSCFSLDIFFKFIFQFTFSLTASNLLLDSFTDFLILVILFSSYKICI